MNKEMNATSLNKHGFERTEHGENEYEFSQQTYFLNKPSSGERTKFELRGNFYEIAIGLGHLTKVYSVKLECVSQSTLTFSVPAVSFQICPVIIQKNVFTLDFDSLGSKTYTYLSH